MTTSVLVLALALGLSAAMALAWLIARRPGQSGWTYVIWTLAVGTASIVAALAPVVGAAITPRQLLVATMVAAWAIRLSFHIGRRTISRGEDPRYAQMRSEWGAGFSARLFWILQIQAAAALLLVVSVLTAARNPASGWGWSDAAGAVILIIAIIGEAIADHQLAQFRQHPANIARICATGLWRRSRHPNYLFEWLGWTAYAVIALGPDGNFGYGWPALSGPILMYWLLVHVSGIPPLEAHMLRSRGTAWRHYRARVSRFWPAFRNQSHNEIENP